MFSDTDLQFIQKRGSSPSIVEQQMRNFETGFPFLPIDRPARAGDGVIRLSNEEADELDGRYEKVLGQKDAVKFVPASGAASRMFKDVFAYVNDPEMPLEGKPAQAWEQIQDFAFYSELMNKVAEADQNNPKKVFKILLGPEGLRYGSLPKGLLSFHQYDHGARTPVEEHLVEASKYAKASDGIARLHFTVSPEHREGFVQLIESKRAAYAEAYDCSFEIDFSEQKAQTDTIAVTMENEPFRLDNGEILFRPGGHGALIENLNDLDADLIFIKNIDNVCPETIQADTYRYKRALATLLLEIQEAAFTLLNQTTLDHAAVENFIEKVLNVSLPKSYVNFTSDEKEAFLRDRLNRPMRVCGMVKNEGEPGGGPFLTNMPDGTISLQVVESAQLDPNDAAVQVKVQDATHFNPVDLICATKDYQGKKFDLLRYVDPRTGFITEKSLQGRALKAQELPGLWNGAMAHWNTIFVEVPITTFNPVKTINDLLRPQHQA
ncbi:MAG: DUF4301 family protein [Bacteroidia bacterium]